METNVKAIELRDLWRRYKATGDPHAIKYVEACQREDLLAGDPIYAIVATDWIRRMEDGTWIH